MRSTDAVVWNVVSLVTAKKEPRNSEKRFGRGEREREEERKKRTGAPLKSAQL